MLHGHAKIELTNVKTGEKKVVEHDNMLTGWIRDMFTPHGVEGHNMAAAQLNYNNSYTQQTFSKENLFRGVILFEDELTNNAEDYCFPSGNKMAAHGDDSAYSGSDPTRGSFNAELSSVSDTEMVSVWDWTQERGNGTISALGLCNRWAGGIGSGQTTPDENTYYFPLFNIAMASGNNSGTNELKIQNAIWMSYSDSILYVLRSMSAGVLTIAKKFIPVSSYDAIMQKINPGARNNAYYDVSKEIEITIDISAYISGNALPAFTAKDGVIYMLPTGNWSGGSKTLVKYEIASGTITTQTLTNNTGKTLYVNNTPGSWGVFGTELYFQTTDSLFAYINMQDNTDCGIVKDMAGNNVAYNGSGGAARFFSAFENFFFSYSTLQTYTSNPIWTIKSKGRAAKTGAAGFQRPLTNSTNVSAVVSLPGNDRKQFFNFAYNDFSGMRWLVESYNWMSLSTKQNLDGAVTKTSDMTMRVTYTIREAT